MLSNVNALMELSFKSVLDALPCYIVIVDPNFNVLYANQRLINDFGDAGDKTCHVLFKDLPEPCTDCLVAQTIQDKQIHVGEGSLNLQRGGQTDIIICTSPLLDILGNVFAVIKIAFSVDQIKEVQQELIFLGQSMALLSHDIKNILEGLQGGAYVVDEGIKDNDMALAGKGWQVVKKNIFDISRITQNILFSTKKRAPENKAFSILSVVKDIVVQYQAKAETMDIQLQYEVNSALPPVKMDQISIIRMLGNLVWNAIEACDKDQKKVSHLVHIRSDFYDKNHFMFEVEDNGKGMDEDTMENVFNEFFTTKGNSGTGLGLVVVDRIIKQHDGKIDILTKLGVGSLFRVIFRLS
jgi:signal transduction histidine kinase